MARKRKRGGGGAEQQGRESNAQVVRRQSGRLRQDGVGAAAALILDGCPICLDEINWTRDVVEYFCCGQMTCASCYKKLGETGHGEKCPTCRQLLPSNCAEGLALLQEHSSSGKAWAHCKLADFFLEGKNRLGDMSEDFEQSDTKAFALFSLAAEQGYAMAQNSLGALYSDGQGVELCLETAADWYLKAAEQGHHQAQLNLGLAYREGEGVEQSLRRAVTWIGKAAQQGHAMAQRLLGCSYSLGSGVEQSEETALLWWRRAAEQGDTNAEGLLGFSYQTGDGVEQSFQNAVEWHTRAAEKGFLLSQLELAQIHYYGSYRPSRRVFGEDAPPSLERGCYWWIKAAAQGSSEAQHILQAVHNDNRTEADTSDALRRAMEAVGETSVLQLYSLVPSLVPVEDHFADW